ncbi:hypothetical protein OAA43_00270 [bacterium]|nr:hypothetical protein [bacterium]
MNMERQLKEGVWEEALARTIVMAYHMESKRRGLEQGLTDANMEQFMFMSTVQLEQAYADAMKTINGE